MGYRQLLGERFGKLLVVEDAGPGKGKHMWRCLCDCGKHTVVASTALTTGNTRSCGCREIYLPTQDQIKAECEKIRATWPKWRLRQRPGVVPWAVPRARSKWRSDVVRTVQAIESGKFSLSTGE